MGNGQSTNMVYKIALGIAGFLLVLLITYFANSVAAQQKFAFENRERIVKIEQCQQNIESNQREMLSAQKEILKNLNELNGTIARLSVGPK